MIIDPLRPHSTRGNTFTIDDIGRKINEIIEQVNSNTRLIEQLRQDYLNHHHEVGFSTETGTGTPIITMAE